LVLAGSLASDILILLKKRERLAFRLVLAPGSLMSVVERSWLNDEKR
jgi:hypothetical protein